MKLAKIITPVLALTIVLSANLVAIPNAEAACSYNGYINSGGKCAKSFKDSNKKSHFDRAERSDRASYTNDYDYFRQESLQRLIELLREQIRRLEAQIDNNNGYSNSSEVDVITRSATNIEDDRATLRGEVDLNNSDEATAYFEYGRTQNNLNKKTSSELIEDNDDNFDFSKVANNLDEGTLYYFRAVAEDEDGDKDRGTILSFRTDGTSNSNRDDEPDVDTNSARNIEDDNAELRGSVDMNDFDNGIVFFVYGEDESAIEDVEDDYDEYVDIDEDGDNLQKVLQDNDLDGSASYAKVVTNLDENTDIYFSICVEYDDEDDDTVIRCGDVETFETD